jgi:outer membrane protein assembly factor BamB
MFNLKKLLWSSAVVAFLLVGCRDSPENRDEETPVDSEDTTEEIEDVEADETNEDETEVESTDTLVGAITDTELTSIDDYDESKWTYADLSSIDHMLENEVFQEENDLYIGTGNNSVMSLGSDFTSVWEDENPYGYQVSIAIDDNYLYNPALGGKRSSGDAVKALDKGTGEVVYEIDIGDYAEMSEILIDDEAIYLTLGYMSDPEEDIYADNISLHKFDKANGDELWSIDFDGVRLSGNRPHHYKLTQSDDLTYLAEEELWTLDMDGYFLVDYAMLDGTLYAFFGSLDFVAEENTLMARIEPETGEVLDMIDMGEHMSAKYNNFYIHMGLTEHDGNLAYFYRNHLFIFNE